MNPNTTAVAPSTTTKVRLYCRAKGAKLLLKKRSGARKPESLLSLRILSQIADPIAELENRRTKPSLFAVTPLLMVEGIFSSSWSGSYYQGSCDAFFRA